MASVSLFLHPAAESCRCISRCCAFIISDKVVRPGLGSDKSADAQHTALPLTLFAPLKQAGLHSCPAACAGAATGTATKTLTTGVVLAGFPIRPLEDSTLALGAGGAAVAEAAAAIMQVPVSCPWNFLLLGLQMPACEDTQVLGYRLVAGYMCRGSDSACWVVCAVLLQGPESIQLWRSSVEPGGHTCTLLWLS